MSVSQGQKCNGAVTAVTNAGTTVATVDVAAMGTTLTGLRFPGWYSPTVGDVVVVDWLGSQPYVAQAFTGGTSYAIGSYASGSPYGSPHTGRSTANPAAGSGGAVPFISGVLRAWSSMQIEVTAAAAGSVYRLGVYADGGGYPAALIGTAGAVPTTAVGLVAVAFGGTFTLDRGLYWLGWQVEGGQPTVRSVTGTVAGIAGLPSGAGTAVGDGWFSGSAFATAGSLPATFPAGLPSTSNMPMVTLVA